MLSACKEAKKRKNIGPSHRFTFAVKDLFEVEGIRLSIVARDINGE
jgi:hypothetical protein